MKNKLILLFILTAVFPLSALTWQESWQHRIDSLSRTSATITVTEVVEKKPKAFLSASFITVPYDFELLRGLVFNYTDSMENLISYIKCWRRVDAGSAYFFQTGFLGVTSYCVLTRDTVKCNTPGFMKIRYKKNYDPYLNESLRKRTRSLVIVDYQGYEITWTLKSLSKDSTRVGLDICMESESHVPRWIYELVVKLIFPRMLGELAAELGKRVALRKARGEDLGWLRAAPKDCCF
jgi:hypothetical protein